MDNAGGTLPCAQVVERIAAYLRDCPVQLGASYSTALEAANRLRQAHESAAELFDTDQTGRVSTQEIVFGTSATMLFNHLAEALKPTLQAGDEVIVTNFDHESNIGCWRRLEQIGVVVREWRLDANLAANPDDLTALLSTKTRIVAYSHCSNILGEVNDIAEINRRIRDAGAISVVDGVAYAPHRPLSVVDWHADFYVMSLYKVFGPHVAAMYGAADSMRELANLNHFFHAESEPALRLQPGSYPYELVAATSGINDYLATLASGGTDSALATAWAAIGKHEAALSQRLRSYLRASPAYELIEGAVDDAQRLPIISFVTTDKPAAQAPAFFDPRNVALRYGSFYAPRLIEHLGLDSTQGVIRVSLAHYNNDAELDRLLEGLDDYAIAN